MFNAVDFLQNLAHLGVQEVCICAGARNAEFVSALDSCEGVARFSFFDERSAAFFALGRSMSHQRPVAIVTTSGTAVAELLPAAIEAYYQNIPLYFITADRPKDYRGTGAPQTIEQSGILREYVSQVYDIDGDDCIPWQDINRNQSIHFNICLPEPTAEFVTPWNWPAVKNIVGAQASPIASSDEVEGLSSLDSSCVDNVALSKPAVIIGQLHENERALVRDFLERTQLPFVAEGHSGIRSHHQNRILLPEKTLQALVENGEVQSVIRIGGVPTLRFWRDLEGQFKELPVTSYSSSRWRGLSRVDCETKSLQMLQSVHGQNRVDLKRDRDVHARFLKLLKKYPSSEVACFRHISSLDCEGGVYLGNSLPIREWDLAATDEKPVICFGNRGANGIDGQLSTFLGHQASTGIFGDLTTLYDLSSGWALSQVQKAKRIIVINNGGGQIFARKFSQKSFLNQHQLDFSGWAKMWNLEYACIDLSHQDSDQSVSDLFVNRVRRIDCHQIIELRPNNEQSNLFWQEFKEMGEL